MAVRSIEESMMGHVYVNPSQLVSLVCYVGRVV